MSSPNKLSTAESHILESIQNVAFDTPGVLPTARGLSHMGEHALGWMVLSALGWSLDKKRRRQWIAVGASAFTAHAASVVIKRIVRRKRPDYSYVRVGVGTPSKLSFPSSHSTSTTAFLVAVARLYGTSVPLAGIPVMMLSRMVLGVHYPTDTAFGAALGAATAEAITRYERKTA
ncbi:phosphatase PAP2 family protein [Corynebacterium sp.]|uniref:phosphatase PAP2 family protein n=1 Tax=Corynebacterium sp. TaxID=1720 RepID=UPI002648164A|nr:phosphatase PAP2 family protein [Corynebacterium sp.]MDN6130432.1 phosphatase PAP2 family protein [Corynebacterium casei]MDN6135994.1 phosphatase PAP2 family protein [Corynebacterium sp.]MDN6154343.1 phosphatase PAP2 family protein [Corynebacterium casei]MDN6737064.1 phosphatase PAP2 family protein [Corynebacterium sp.]